MLDGRYDAIRAHLSRKKTGAEASKFWDVFLEELNEKDDKGNYKHDLTEWNFQELLKACYGSDVYAGRAPGGMNLQEATQSEAMSLNEAVGTASFPQITTGLINSQALRSYDEMASEFPFIGDALVSRKKTNKKSEKLVRFSDHPLYNLTREGQDSQPFEVSEEYFTYKTYKFTREIDITDELVIFDQTNELWGKVRELGRAARMTKEYFILHGIQDLNASHLFSNAEEAVRVYYPSNAAASLWSASVPYGVSNSGNQFSNTLVDWTDIQAAGNRLDNFYNAGKEGLTDQSTSDGLRMGEPIDAKVLVPRALRDTAWQIFKSDRVNSDANNAANPARAGGPENREWLWSPILDNSSTSSWYYGAFKRAFHLYEVFPFRLLTCSKAQSQALMRRGIYAWAKGEYYHGLVATTNRLCVKCT